MDTRHLSLSDRVICHVREQYGIPMEKVLTMLPTFITVLQNHMRSLEQVLEESDLEAIGKAGHGLKGALLNLGLTEFAALAERIEKEGKAGNQDTDYGGLAAALREKLEEIL